MLTGIAPDGRIKRYHTDEERFWDKVDIKSKDDCWIWLASNSGNRYGKYKNNKKFYQAHRYAWILTNGSIPDDVLVLHKCDNGFCVNPNHLYLGSQSDNMRDRSLRYKGRTGPSCKVDIEDIVYMKSAIYNKRMTQAELARLFGISPRYVGDLVTGVCGINATPRGQ